MVVVVVVAAVVYMRVCVVVLLGVLSMRRAAVIGKSIPDDSNQLAPRSSIIRTRGLTVRSVALFPDGCLPLLISVENSTRRGRGALVDIREKYRRE